MSSGKKIVLSMGLAVAFAGLSQAAPISIPTSDGYTSMSGYAPGGGTSYYYSGYYYTTESTEIFLKYDLSALAAPAGQQVVVNSAAIVVAYTSLANGDPFTENLYSVTGDSWSSATPAWNDRPATGATPLASKTNLGAYSTGPNSDGHVFDSTADLVNYVQQQANGDGTISFMIKATDLGPAPENPDSGSQNQYYTYDPSQSTSPHLVIDYSYVPVPEPMTGGLLAAGLLAAVSVRRRRSAV